MSLQSFLKKIRSSSGSEKQMLTQPCILMGPVRVPYGAFQFKIRIGAGVSYEIQSTTNLKDWDSIDRNTANGNEIEYVDSNASKFSYRFYRVRVGNVLSANVIGYASITAPPGFSMIANPFESPNSSVSEIFGAMPDGTSLSKFNPQFSKLTENKIKGGAWTNPSEKLLRSEGAIFFNPTYDYKTLNFVGEVKQGKFSTPIPAGFSIRSSFIPQPGRLHSDLNFPISEGDVIHQFDSSSQKYVLYPYDEKSWASNPPIVSLGESFWVAKKTAKNWVQSFFSE